MQHEETDDLGMDKSVLHVLAANVETLRSAPGGVYLSQGDVARRAGFDQTTLGRILKMETWPTLENITRLALAFHKLPWQLLAPDLGIRIREEDSNLSPTGVSIARRFDAIKDDAERARAYAFISQTLEFANFSAYPVASRGTPATPKPRRTRTRRKAPGEDPDSQTGATDGTPPQDPKA